MIRLGDKIVSLWNLTPAERVDLGYCSRCCRVRRGLTNLCHRCLVESRKHNAKSHMREKISGRCVDCPQPCQEDNCRCAPCQAKNKERGKKTYAQRLAENRCTRCGGDRDGVQKMCKPCRDIHAEHDTLSRTRRRAA